MVIFGKYKKIIVRLLVLSLLFAFMSALPEIKASAAADYSAIFDATYYADKYEDVKAAFGNNEDRLFEHFVRVGMKEGRQACQEFDVYSYMARYGGLRKQYGDNLSLYYYHYWMYGKSEGRDASYNEAISEKTAAMVNAGKEAKTDGASFTSSVSVGDAADFYDKAVFVGDSIMTGYAFYANGHENSVANRSDFLALKSFAVFHAIKPVEDDDKQPPFRGKVRNIWDSMDDMDIDKVFLMFGTNDLVCFGPVGTCERYVTLVNLIKEAHPDFDIYVISMTATYPGVSKSYLNNKNVAIMNGILEMQAKNNGYKYLDLNSYVVDENGDQITSYSSDKYVHVTQECYRDIWEKVLYEYAAKEISLN